MQFSHPKRPRQYAGEIAALPRAQRAAAIAQAPAEYRAIIQHYLDDWESRGVLREAARTQVLRDQMAANDFPVSGGTSTSCTSSEALDVA